MTCQTCPSRSHYWCGLLLADDSRELADCGLAEYGCREDCPEATAKPRARLRMVSGVLGVER